MYEMSLCFSLTDVTFMPKSFFFLFVVAQLATMLSDFRPAKSPHKAKPWLAEFW